MHQNIVSLFSPPLSTLKKTSLSIVWLTCHCCRHTSKTYSPSINQYSSLQRGNAGILLLFVFSNPQRSSCNLRAAFVNQRFLHLTRASSSIHLTIFVRFATLSIFCGQFFQNVAGWNLQQHTARCETHTIWCHLYTKLCSEIGGAAVYVTFFWNFSAKKAVYVCHKK